MLRQPVTTQALKGIIYSYRRSRATIRVGRVRNRWSAPPCCAPHTTGRAVGFRTGMPAGGPGQNLHFLGDFVPCIKGENFQLFRTTDSKWTRVGARTAPIHPPALWATYDAPREEARRSMSDVLVLPLSPLNARGASPEPANTRVVRGARGRHYIQMNERSMIDQQIECMITEIVRASYVPPNLHQRTTDRACAREKHTARPPYNSGARRRAHHQTYPTKT